MEKNVATSKASKGLIGRIDSLNESQKVEAWQVPSPWPGAIDPPLTWMPVWVRDALASGKLSKSVLTNYVQVSETGLKAMPGDWIVRLLTSQWVFIVMTASEFAAKFVEDRPIATDRSPIDDIASLRRAVSQVADETRRMSEALQTIDTALGRGDPSVRGLYDALHKHFGGSSNPGSIERNNT